MSYQHILFTTDLSKESLTLGDKAKAIAQKLSAKLTVCHIVEPPAVYPQQFASTEKLLHKMQASAEKTLTWYLEVLEIPHENGILCTGNIAQQIKMLVHRDQIDCVFIGQQGAGSLYHVIGSTANELTQTLPIDVFILNTRQLDTEKFKEDMRIYSMDELVSDKDAMAHYTKTTDTLAQKVAREKPHKVGVASSKGVQQATKRGPKPSLRPPSSPYGDPEREEED